MFLIDNIVTLYFHTFQIWNHMTYFAAGSLCLLISLTYFFLLASLLPFGNHLFILCIYDSVSVLLFIYFLASTCKWNHTCFVFLCLFRRENSLKPDKCCQKWHDFVLLYAWIGFYCIFVCIHIYMYVCICTCVGMYMYSLIHLRTLRLLWYLDYCK